MSLLGYNATSTINKIAVSSNDNAYAYTGNSGEHSRGTKFREYSISHSALRLVPTYGCRIKKNIKPK